MNFKKEAGLGIWRSARLRAGRSRVRIPTKASKFSLNRPDRLYGPPSPIFNVGGTGRVTGSFPGVKRSRREAVRSPSPSAEVRNQCSPICLPGVDRDKFDFFLPFVNIIIFYLVSVCVLYS